MGSGWDVAAQDAAQWRAEQVAQLTEELAQLQRTFGRGRTRLLDAARHDVERATQVLVSALAASGPMRLGALAAVVQSDPSTVSRQVAALVRDGYVERRADPDDGRAVVLAVTAEGEQVYREHQQRRHTYYAEIFETWSSEDVVTFTCLLGRFEQELAERQAAWAPRLGDAAGR